MSSDSSDKDRVPADSERPPESPVPERFSIFSADFDDVDENDASPPGELALESDESAATDEWATPPAAVPVNFASLDPPPAQAPPPPPIEDELEAAPVDDEPVEPVPLPPPPLLDDFIDESESGLAEDTAPLFEAVAPPVPEAISLECPMCKDPCKVGDKFCSSCGFVFPNDPAMQSAAQPPVARAAPVPGAVTATPVAIGNPGNPHRRLKNRYEVHDLICERLGVSRYSGRDLGIAGIDSIPIVIVSQPLSDVTDPAGPDSTDDLDTFDGEKEILPGFDDPGALMAGGPPTDVLPTTPRWPNVAWERLLLDVEDLGLPRVLDSFIEDGTDYLIAEVPEGASIWDAWDDPEATYAHRFAWLAQLATTLQTLKNLNAMPETITPDKIIIDVNGRARITDTSDLLPIPLPENAPLLANHYTAPELLSSTDQVDARAMLYSFGAMLSSLHIGRSLSDVDFEKPGHPKPFIPLFPDVHPMLGRLMSKTFVRSVEARFPSDEAAREDSSGLSELIRVLKTCGRVLDNVRLEVAAWTTTGMVRTGNEDAFSLLHHSESRQDDFCDCAMVLLADGMGGYEAGEVAAAIALQELRSFMMQQAPFRALTQATGFSSDVPNPAGNVSVPLDVSATLELLKTALKDTNRKVHTASRTGGRRGMGCTAEVVYVDGRNLIVGHVGDSRTYHYSEGRLTQVTRDQTLVNRLVELGQLTEEEAEEHPRKNELQQAIGGQPDVDPGLYHVPLRPGDVIVVCSDGLVNHVNNRTLKEFLLDESFSAEVAARRLVNLTNIHGATDNTTVVVIRAT